MKKLILSIALLAAAVPALAQQGGCVAIAVSSEQKGGGKFDTSFSATRVIDIDFSVVFTPGAAKRFLDGNHLVEFRILTPRGHLYQSMTIPFTADAKRKGAKVKVEGYPDPMAVRTMDDVVFDKGNHVRVSTRMPVAGTPIIWSSLYGTWTAQAFVDGESVPCAKGAAFTIVQ